MGGSEPAASEPARVGAPLLAVYDEALPHVYGYVRARCESATVAEDLTADTFLAAAAAIQRPDPPPVSVRWLLGVARHKLADHWRREFREQRRLSLVARALDAEFDDPWEARLDAVLAHQTLSRLAPQHRAALTLRYVDDLPVREVAAALGRSEHATEALLTRARNAFRHTYPSTNREGERRG
ncbi:sigma-70 family RNA polymerase sigma factor [soil metagenome]